MKNKLSYLLLGVAIATVQLPMASISFAADAEKPKRKVQLVGPSVGKKIAKAFEAYSADDIPLALEILNDINAKKDYDKAYLARFKAVMYATSGNEKSAIEQLKLAVAPDILNEGDHGEALKLLADLQLQAEEFEEALGYYKAWMDFTGKADGQTWTKIANAHLQLKQMDKVIAPADKAIAANGDKQNQNPYILKITSFYERKMYKESIGVLETVVQLFPETKQWWIQLGQFYTLVEDYDKALATLQLAYMQGFLEKESQLKVLSSLYSQAEIPVKAAAILEKHIDAGTIKRDDKNLSTLAYAFHAALNLDKAAKYYGEVAKMTNEPKHYSKQGMLLKQNEKFKAAIVALNKALDLGAKNNGRIQMSLAESHFYLGQYKKAYAAIKIAAKDPKTRKGARGWVSFIKDTAARKKVSI